MEPKPSPSQVTALRTEACASCCKKRWGGFKALRERWFSHLEPSRCRPVLLIDEAQETRNFCPGTRMTPQVLSELRLLASARFDSQPLLCIVIAGVARLIEKLRREELIPLGSRIRTRFATEFASRDELLACLDHLLAGAGNASLMTPQLRHTQRLRLCGSVAATPPGTPGLPLRGHPPYVMRPSETTLPSFEQVKTKDYLGCRGIAATVNSTSSPGFSV
jgi:hypothetical protein